MTAYYEKPKGWNEAPRESWVSGMPIGQSDIKMPKLGDPAENESSTKVSFDDSLKAETTYRVGPGGEQIKPGQPCPPGTETRGTACMPSPESALSNRAIESRSREEGGEESTNTPDTSFQRDIERTPRGGKPHPQIARLATTGKRE